MPNTPNQPDLDPDMTAEQRKVDELFAQMDPVQRALTLAYMQGVLTSRAA